MSHDVSVPQHEDVILTLITTLSDGTTRPFAGTGVSNEVDLEIHQTAEDGTTPLTADRYRLRVADENPGGYSAMFTDGDATLAVNLTKAQPVVTATSIAATDEFVPRI